MPRPSNRPAGRGTASPRSTLRALLTRLALTLALTAGPAQAADKLKAALLAPTQVTPRQLCELRAQGYNAIVLQLTAPGARADAEAARRIRAANFPLHYWIEVARNPVLADAHPAWMASIQGHPEYRRFFPTLRAPETNEVVKTYPWVPLGYEESFAAHVARVKEFLAALPRPDGIFLNDLQGAPSACGCGHHLCRWTTDYGPVLTATPKPNAAAAFMAEVQRLAPDARVVPVWVSECEQHDKNDLCGGVGCYVGTCWRELSQQVAPVLARSGTLALLAPYKEFKRDLPRYGPTAGWVKEAVRLMSELLPERGGQGIPPDRLLVVLQGWDVTPVEVAAQLARADESGAAGCVVAMTSIEQGWEPRVVPVSRFKSQGVVAAPERAPNADTAAATGAPPVRASAASAPGSWLPRWRRENATWRGVHVMVGNAHAASELMAEFPELAALGVNALVVEINYNFAFESHPELRSANALTKEQAARLARECRERGMRPIPLFNCLGHQSWSKSTGPLLTKYPEFDETPGQFPENKGIYCRSWCPQHPQVNEIVFALLDELVTAFAADAVHVGMDEVFLIASEHCPRCKGGDPAKLFAKAVNELHGHLVGQRKVEMLLWADRLLDAAATGYGEWEAAKNGTHPAVDLIPKDIILCDWHYLEPAKYPGKPADYVSIPFFLEKGFRVWPAGWKNVAATEALLAAGQKHQHERLLGHLCTTWGAVKIRDLAEWPPIRAAAKK